MQKRTVIRIVTRGYRFGMVSDEFTLTQTINSIESDFETLSDVVKSELISIQLSSQHLTQWDVQRNVFFESFGGDSKDVPKFFNQLLLSVGEDYYFEIKCSPEVEEHLTQEQKENIECAFEWMDNILLNG